MTQTDYIDYFQAKAQKMGDNVTNKFDRRFAVYTPDADALPDVSRFSLNLKQFCLLCGLYDTRVQNAPMKGSQFITHNCELMILKCPKNANNFQEELEIMNEAEQVAIELYRAMYHEGHCQNLMMKVIGNAQLMNESWEIQKVMKLHDSSCGVIINLQLREQINFQNFQTTNRFLQ